MLRRPYTFVMSSNYVSTYIYSLKGKYCDTNVFGEVSLYFFLLHKKTKVGKLSVVHAKVFDNEAILFN